MEVTILKTPFQFYRVRLKDFVKSPQKLPDLDFNSTECD
ncbi:MAG: hypothetical protein H6Q14_1232 [Bacteroidetes bacterium]|nr:hypothetical protein [Bacteroidota bacterium]